MSRSKERYSLNTTRMITGPKEQGLDAIKKYEAQIRELNKHIEREICHRKKAKDELVLIKNKYRQLLDNIPCIIAIVDNKGNISSWNRYAQNIFGYRASDITGKNITLLNGSDPHFPQLLNEPENGVNNTRTTPFYDSWEGEAFKANGQPLWIEWSIARPESKNAAEGIICIGIDRTTKKRIEEQAIQDTEDRAITHERTRLARELHDAVSQTIFSVSLIAEVVPLLWERDQEEGRRRLREIGQLTRGALAEMRTLLMELRPSALAKASISELISQLALAVNSRTLIEIEVAAEQCILPVDIKLALYRITQEALNNVVKHSRANHAKITLSCSAEQVELRISDNGQGFNMNEISDSSLGMRIIHERAEGIGADLEIKSQHGCGTDIIVRLNNVSREVSA